MSKTDTIGASTPRSEEEIAEIEFRSAFSEAVNNDVAIDWRYWAHQMARWSTAEAARLMCALDPDIFESLDARPNKNDPTDLTLKAKKIQRLAEGQGVVSATPTEWLKWADVHGLQIHDGLRIEVEATAMSALHNPELELSEVLRINEAAKMLGCSIDSLLREAETEQRLLYVGLGPHVANLTAIPSHPAPHIGRNQYRSHKIVAMLPQYARSLAMTGRVEVSKWQASFDGGALDWHFWVLEVPQTVEVDQVYISAADLSAATAPEASAHTTAASSKHVPKQRSQENEILRVLKDLGYDAAELPKGINGRPGVKAEVKKRLSADDKDSWLGTIFDKAWERLMSDERIGYKTALPQTGG